MVLLKWESLSLIKCSSNGIILVNKEFEREINDSDKSLRFLMIIFFILVYNKKKVFSLRIQMLRDSHFAAVRNSWYKYQ